MSSKKLSISKQIFSITEVAMNCNLSRARFYQLLGTGFFPKPLHDDRSKRPYYNLDLQQKCQECRQSGVGIDGSFMLFYSPRKKETKPRAFKTVNLTDLKCKEFVETLNSMGLDCPDKEVSIALSELYPEGTEGQDQGVVIRELYRHLKQLK
jgi:hypothetical protein